MEKFNEYGEKLITVYYVADDFMGQHGNTIEKAEISENDYLYFKKNGIGGSMFLTYPEAADIRKTDRLNSPPDESLKITTKRRKASRNTAKEIFKNGNARLQAIFNK